MPPRRSACTARPRTAPPTCVGRSRRLAGNPRKTVKAGIVSTRSDLFRTTSAERVLVADGAMGTMLQASDPDPRGLPGPRGLQRDPQRHPAGHRPRRARRLLRGRASTRVETNTFGANLANLGEYDIPERIHELAEAGARIAREAADAWSTDGPARAGCSARSGPGTKLPTLGPRAVRRAARRLPEQVRGLVERRRRRAAHRDLPRTCCRPRRRSSAPSARWPRRATTLPVIVQVTVETTGTMLLGSRDRRGADRAGAAGHRRDRPQLRDRPGRDERAPAPPVAARPDRGCRCMPNAGLPELGPRRRALPARRRPELAEAHEQFAREFGARPGRRLLRHDARAPAPGRRGGRAAAPVAGAPAAARGRRGLALPDGAVPAGRRRTCRSASAPTPTAPRRSARRCSRAGWDDCVEIARDQTRDGAHLLDVCVDYVGRDGVDDMQRGRRPARHRVARCRSCSTPPSRR